MSNSQKLVMTASAAVGALAALAFAPIAFAQDATAAVGVSAGINANVGGSNANARASATGTAKLNDNATSSRSESNAGGSARGVETRSEAATQVQALLQVADRVGGIGEDVRIVAREHASSSARVDEAQAEVEGRPAWLTFIIGTDYGNLGKLRSEIRATENHIKRLSDARDRTVDVSAKAELQVQIDALAAQASTTAEFVAENESKFSVLGWFFRLFQ